MSAPNSAFLDSQRAPHQAPRLCLAHRARRVAARGPLYLFTLASRDSLPFDVDISIPPYDIAY